MLFNLIFFFVQIDCLYHPVTGTTTLHVYRRVQLPEGGADLQEGVLLLPHHHLRALLHARHRLLGLLLAGPECHSCQVTHHTHSSLHPFCHAPAPHYIVLIFRLSAMFVYLSRFSIPQRS